MLAAYANREEQIRGMVKDMVSTYFPEKDHREAVKKIA